jgi:hypothetical protein
MHGLRPMRSDNRPHNMPVRHCENAKDEAMILARREMAAELGGSSPGAWNDSRKK